MYLAIITLPLLGSLLSGGFGRKIGVSGAQLITCLCVITTTIFAILGFFEVVSSLVHVYSIGYMSHDPHNQRFFSYLSLFTFMMVILVTSNNFLLIIAANQSSLSAFLTNRVGDCFLTIGMFAILLSFGNIDYSTVFSLAPFMSEDVVTIVGICLLIGAMAKSSQIGPTPVSALIHAATMVTAGVYLLMRAITTVFSSLIGLFQQDIKKVIAYSTMSQLGMMVIAVVNHAFYKALLFLGAGAVIHAVADNQDFRKYGGLRPFLPLTYSVMLIASLSLVAFPFMTGFYSKDFILESAYGQFYFSATVVYFIATIGAMFTTLYSVKAHEGDIFMSIPLIVLAVFSIFFGYVTKDIFIGLGSGFFADNILSEFLPKLLIHFKLSRLEMFYNRYITDLVLKLGGQTTKVIDKGSVELLGPFGLEIVLIRISKSIASLDTGLIFYILTPYLYITIHSVISFLSKKRL
ncbi:hypothetical protein RGQ29_032150 [Quercus rubra]|uniref:NADH dehydrogenase subunit 5 n=1 Tax=Quercus rubra TaxID=3512 RepID=A0AAN7DSI2_QUERU|nr:hypothetical protein RGQ29_032150 [Quercus rubra]